MGPKAWQAGHSGLKESDTTVKYPERAGSSPKLSELFLMHYLIPLILEDLALWPKMGVSSFTYTEISFGICVNQGILIYCANSL